MQLIRFVHFCKLISTRGRDVSMCSFAENVGGDVSRVLISHQFTFPHYLICLCQSIGCHHCKLEGALKKGERTV